MKKITYLLLTLIAINGVQKSYAQTAIFSPGMTITGLNSVNAPAAEDLDKAIDGTTTKFLDFDEFDGMGFTVNLGGASLRARAIEITTANDSPDRDPMDYEVLGSTNGTTFTSIGSGAIPCISTRFAVRQFNFTNNTSYNYYRINFATRCGTPSEMQVAEVQLYDDYFCTAPSNLAANNITTTTADLSWTETWLATTWDIEYGVSGFSPTGTPTINNTTANPYSLTGLTAATSYEFYVRADCGGSTSSWSGPYTFTTACTVPNVDCGGFGGLDIGTINCGGSPYIFSGNTTGANIDCGLSSAGDHMYTFTLSVAADVTLDVCNASWDTQMHLFDLSNGNCDGGAINSNDDGCGSQSIITENALSAGTYVVVVEGYSSNEGAYDLNITVTNCANLGDEPCDAIAAPVTCGSKVIADNIGKTNSGISAPSCGNYTGGDVWFESTIPTSGTVDIDVVSVESSITDVSVAAYTAATCGGVLTQIGCNNNSMPSLSLTGLTSGNTLYIRVWENGNNQTGQFEIEVTDPSSLYCLNNDASMYNFPTDTCMQVSADATSQKGCAWYQNTLDFSVSFDHTLEVYLGDDDGGGDGMTFVFHNDPLGTSVCGNDGSGLGASGISNALVVEVDTYDNDSPGHTWDLAEDHIAIWTSSTGYTNPIAGPVTATNSNSDIEDGAVHELRLLWISGTNTLEVYFDGNLRLSATDDFITNVFGSKNVFWGSTASTGGVTNQMYVCPPRSLINPVLNLNMFDFNLTCNNDNVNLSWKAKYSENVNFYEVQASRNGNDFKTIKTINNINTDTYSTNCNTQSGYKYFRIKEVYIEGNSKTSTIRKTTCNDNIFDDIIVFSNNETKQIVFDMKSLEGSFSINLFTIEGKILHNSLLVDEKHYMLDASTFANGIYYAKIKVEGRNPIVKKIYIQ